MASTRLCIPSATLVIRPVCPGGKDPAVILPEFLQCGKHYSLPDSPHGVKVKVEIMQRVKGACRHLACVKKMTQIGARKVAAGVAAARGHRAVRSSSAYSAFLMFRRPGAREQLAVARIARRQHAIEHVDAARHALDEIDAACRHPSDSEDDRPAAAAPSARSRRTSSESARRRSSPPIAYASKPIASVPSTLCRRRSGNVPP